MSPHGIAAPTRQHSDLTLVALGRELDVAATDKEKAEPRSLVHVVSRQVQDSKPHVPPQYRPSVDPASPPLEAIDEYDIAPVDQPPEIQALQDREPFAILARHLSGPAFEPPPDGGLEAWLVVMGAWFVLFVQFGINGLMAMARDCWLLWERQPQ
ncbi:hypothetical protein QFC19_002528 [Naganishia cerealis]|uniref:Uncharacterized protein n=1 Tax=Naganishia cerealis TaxID=610337 RepID=A0ACC2W944_9TREE|nr:hypothetical protein QFC19_002528 [Naganishia cerealis]